MHYGNTYMSRILYNDEVGRLVWSSIFGPMLDSVGESVENSVDDSVWMSVWDSVGNSVYRDSVGNSVRDLYD